MRFARDADDLANGGPGRGGAVLPTKSSTAIAMRARPKPRVNAYDVSVRVRNAPPTAPGTVATANLHPRERSTRRCRR
jgi:hypothetical protein